VLPRFNYRVFHSQPNRVCTPVARFAESDIYATRLARVMHPKRRYLDVLDGDNAQGSTVTNGR